MAEQSEEKKGTHAGRVRRHGGIKKTSLVLPPDAKDDWPLNLRELLEWYGHQVTDVSKAAQLRITEATRIVDDCFNGKTTLKEAGERVSQYDHRWRDVFRGLVDHVRGMTDEEIYKAMDDSIERQIQQQRERSR